MKAVAALVAYKRKYTILCSRHEQDSHIKKQAVVPCGVWKGRIEHKNIGTKEASSRTACRSSQLYSSVPMPGIKGQVDGCLVTTHFLNT
jgi:hypothetical protein